jgi:uncharacterized protein (UPF0335 family)
LNRSRWILGPGKGTVLDEQLRDLMQELGNAINESLSESDRIAGVIGEIKRAGFDVFLVLEATIGFNKRQDSVEEDDDQPEPQMEIEELPYSSSRDNRGRIRFTSQDQKFLRALKIAADED